MKKSLEINNKSYLTFNGLGNFLSKKQINLKKQKVITVKLFKLIQKDLLKYIKIVLILEKN